MTRALPRLVVVTDRAQLPHGADLVTTIEECVAAGARAVLLRERDLPEPERADLASDVAEVLASVGGLLLCASPDITDGTAAGVHLRAPDPLPRTRPAHLGRSTHTLEELVRAAREGCDYVTLSPVGASVSKPGHGPALGVAGLTALLEQAHEAAGGQLPRVLALGGITPANAGPLVAQRDGRPARVHGVAVMGEVMRSPHPGRTVRQLLEAL